MPADSSRTNGQRAANDKSVSNSNPDAPAPVRHRKANTKRARGLISCAECARLKVRCDKNIPCSSCVRRGCSTICPNGVLSGKQGTRYVLANTEALHDKIREMCERIRQLEDALAILQATTTTVPHPLLREELLAIKKGIEVTIEEPEDDAVDVSVTDEFGTLSISDHGIARFIGRTGGLDSLLVAATIQYANSLEVDEPEDSANDINDVPIEILVNNIKPHLPTYERASALCESYMEQSTWFMYPIRREQLINELLMPVYKSGSAQANGYSSTIPCLNNAHELALLLLVFALGSLADLTLPARNQEAKSFFKLALALINLESILINPSLATVQALCSLSCYYIKSDSRSSREKGWSLIRMASMVASNIGLHRDPSKWKLDPKSTQRRREVFWQICTTECGQSLANGRPPITSFQYSDCEFPDDTEETLKNDGTIEPGFWHWRYRFAKEVVHHLADIGCRTGPVKYSEVLELDRKIRDFDFPEKLKTPAGGSDWEIDGARLCMRRALVLTMRDIAMIYLHRGFYAKALLQYAKDPIGCPFGPSFLATYRSSLSALQTVREQFKLCPEMMLRTWSLWKHGFSALVVIGSVVVRAPHCNLAPSALKELSEGMELFKNAAQYTKTARHAYSVLSALQEHAVKAYSQYRNGQRRLMDGEVVNPDDSVKAWENELAIFSGQTTLIEPVEQRTSRSSVSSPRWAMLTPSNGSPPQGSLSTMPTNPPSLMQGAQNGFTTNGYSYDSQNPDMQNWDNRNLFPTFNNIYNNPLGVDSSTSAPIGGQASQIYVSDGNSFNMEDVSQMWENPAMNYSDLSELLGFQFGHGQEMAEDWSSLLQGVAPSSFNQS